MSTNQTRTPGLPVKRDLAQAYTLTLIITLLLVAASLVGLLTQGRLYPDEELRQSLLPNDVVNLLVGVPILLLSLWLTRSGKLRGLLLWPGALVYVIYNYIAYLVAMPLGWMSLVYLALEVLSIFVLIVVFSSIKMDEVGEKLDGKVPARFAGGIVAVFGFFFILRVLIIIVGSVIGNTPIEKIELATLVADLAISPLMVIGGISLWRRKAFGYTAGLGLLFQASMLFIGLIILMLLQPLLTDAPSTLGDVLVVAVMGLVCFAPFGLYLRGVSQVENK
ncbi:MAG: hypothetical protein ABFS17_10780 [Chloroflexota bacterium]